MPGIFIPDEAIQRIKAAGDEGARVGVELAVELIEQMKGWVAGIYMMPQFHRYDMAAEITEAVSKV